MCSTSCTFGVIVGSTGENTFTSKHPGKPVFQEPFMYASCAPMSFVLADASLRDSPDSSCKCGSIAVLGQTSVDSNVVKFLISFVVNRKAAHMWQTIARSTMKEFSTFTEPGNLLVIVCR